MSKLKYLLIGAIAASALSSQAMADTTNGYGVATAAGATNVYTGVGAVSAYRTGQDSSFNYTRPGDVASVQYQNCAAYSGNPGAVCSGGAFGTNSTDNNLTASSNNVNFTDNIGDYSGTVASGTASARSDLATGELGAYAYSDVYREFGGGPTFIGAAGFSQFNDTLTFTIAGATASTITNINIVFELDGATALSGTRGAGAFVTETLYFGDGFAQYALQDLVGDSDYVRGGDRNWVSSSWDFSTPGVVRFSGVYALTGASSVIGINNSLLASVNASSLADFASTSHFRLSTPSNVSFTSASGVFLSGLGGGTGGGVPEPATWALMLAGFGLVGSALRRRRGAGALLA